VWFSRIVGLVVLLRLVLFAAAKSQDLPKVFAIRLLVLVLGAYFDWSLICVEASASIRYSSFFLILCGAGTLARRILCPTNGTMVQRTRVRQRERRVSPWAPEMNSCLGRPGRGETAVARARILLEESPRVKNNVRSRHRATNHPRVSAAPGQRVRVRRQPRLAVRAELVAAAADHLHPRPEQLGQLELQLDRVLGQRPLRVLGVAPRRPRYRNSSTRFST
jgi:hypothetical protein